MYYSNIEFFCSLQLVNTVVFLLLLSETNVKDVLIQRENGVFLEHVSSVNRNVHLKGVITPRR